MDTTNLKILDATETTLTFSLPPVSAKTVIQFKPYGADWGLEGVGGEVEVTQGGERDGEGVGWVSWIAMLNLLQNRQEK